MYRYLNTNAHSLYYIRCIFMCDHYTLIQPILDPNPFRISCPVCNKPFSFVLHILHYDKCQLMQYCKIKIYIFFMCEENVNLPTY